MIHYTGKRCEISALPHRKAFAIVVVALIAPSVIGVALLGVMLSCDKFARTMLTAGSVNAPPLEIYGMTRNIATSMLCALCIVTTLSLVVIISCIFGVLWLRQSATPEIARG